MNRQILGDKRKSSFDDNLADVVNKIFDSLPENSKPKVILQEGILGSDKIIALDEEGYSFNNISLSQELWLANWMNDSVMISMGDLYCLSKFMRTNLVCFVCEYNTDHSFNGYIKVKSSSVRTGLRNDINKKQSLLTSTRLSLVKNPSGPREYDLIQHYKSEKFVESRRIFVPEYDREEISKVLKTNEGLIFLQNLFQTKDDAKEIEENITYLLKEIFKGNEVFISTPNERDVISSPDRVCGIKECLKYQSHFEISAREFTGFEGRTRGVRYVQS
ncbi:hypothetical protein HZA97_01075 [Candidatus Woesearchaeota archaeon]|nr:hypothetical protein [Candidatus Woesearchaeota archaeon]